MEAFLTSVRGYGRFSEEDLALLMSRVREQTLAKKETLLSEGEVCRALYFVVSGALRQYRITTDNEEVTVGLYLDGDWVVQQRSFLSQQPSDSVIDACEGSQLLVLDVGTIHHLIEKAPAFFQLGKLLEVPPPPTNSNGHPLNPEERYRGLLATNPRLVRRFPLKHIASYLNMTPETLSRVRKKISRFPD